MAKLKTTISATAEGRGRGPGIAQSDPGRASAKIPPKAARKTGVYIGGVYNACCHDKATEQAGGVYKKAAAKPGKSNAATNRRTEQLTEPPGY